jgi:putative heme-binding domain-containing protein
MHDESAQVRRECAIALRMVPPEQKAAALAGLARSMNSSDRWELEALGIGAEGAWSQVLKAWEAADATRGIATPEAEARWAAVRKELVWRARGPEAAQAIANSILAGATAPGAANNPATTGRWFRALDFQPKDAVAPAMKSLLGSAALQSLDADSEERAFVISEALQRAGENPLSDPELAGIVKSVLDSAAGTSRFVRMVRQFGAADRYPELLKQAQSTPGEQLGVESMAAIVELQQWDLLTQALTGEDTLLAIATAEAMGNTANGAIAGPLMAVIQKSDASLDVRRAAVKAVARVNNGALELVKMVDAKSLDADLEQAVAAALHGSPSRQAREQAQRLFPLPPSKDNQPTPPIGELAKIQGDLPNGRIVFFSTGTCHKCHVVDGMGREIGPNLTEIGSKLSREAMFESILYPSAGISHNYEAWTVVLSSGTTVNGLLVSNTDAEVVIRGDDALVRRFPKSDVEELVKQKISLMPADLQKTMTSQELADVVEYMQSLKKK